ncbi:hypothetical protein GSH05_09150 [Burkholderia pseudomallei]|uniref:Uncharacterized protein n=5 Tax=pseudomallei group TaxID=111527 RepID=A2S4Z2_BURM9|nr:hypothetical protein BMA2234 [Burkholderia mallei ATCC 23344]ABN01460.1 conserved hypothetical protein [Burkholderia mallei NCTC 10229]ABN91685.1 conserved hypothetical protein [Burkholderia pseudomallei 1106a]ABO04021.1 conserved hypothetical protein [Burkholderia mallei NCTC 10247]AFR14854.1 hypothetical protein BPC006_I0967 [Burkholderia pseudomallei BPC006]AIW49429.1 hypothetical protein DM57_15630 [Burkholderia mallei]APD36126.1 hypothetical protein BK015_13975 [Burkholderia pseudomal
MRAACAGIAMRAARSLPAESAPKRHPDGTGRGKAAGAWRAGGLFCLVSRLPARVARGRRSSLRVTSMRAAAA